MCQEGPAPSPGAERVGRGGCRAAQWHRPEEGVPRVPGDRKGNRLLQTRPPRRAPPWEAGEEGGPQEEVAAAGACLAPRSPQKGLWRPQKEARPEARPRAVRTEQRAGNSESRDPLPQARGRGCATGRGSRQSPHLHNGLGPGAGPAASTHPGAPTRRAPTPGPTPAPPPAGSGPQADPHPRTHQPRPRPRGAGITFDSAPRVTQTSPRAAERGNYLTAAPPLQRRPPPRPPLPGIRTLVRRLQAPPRVRRQREGRPEGRSGSLREGPIGRCGPTHGPSSQWGQESPYPAGGSEGALPAWGAPVCPGPGDARRVPGGGRPGHGAHPICWQEGELTCI